jgi:hypothetical protein
MAGWIKIYRELADHWLAQHPEKLGWWVLLLLKVAHEDKKVLVGNQMIELKRGQIIASLTYLADLWQTSKRTAERFVELLEKEQMLRRCVSRKVSIITICNYESYQEKKRGKRADECADDAPIGIQSVSEIKNIKEDKEIYNTPTAHTCTCESEQDFIDRYRTEGMWADACLILHLKSIADCQQLFDRWITEYQHNGDTHQSYSDFKKHFIQWARITIQKEKNNGSNSQSNQRRGVQVVANSVEDYQGAF